MLYACDPSVCSFPYLRLVLFIILCVLFGISPVLFSYYTNKLLSRTGNTISFVGLVELGIEATFSWMATLAVT